MAKLNVLNATGIQRVYRTGDTNFFPHSDLQDSELDPQHFQDSITQAPSGGEEVDDGEDFGSDFDAEQIKSGFEALDINSNSMDNGPDDREYQDELLSAVMGDEDEDGDPDEEDEEDEGVDEDGDEDDGDSFEKDSGMDTASEEDQEDYKEPEFDKEDVPTRHGYRTGVDEPRMNAEGNPITTDLEYLRSLPPENKHQNFSRGDLSRINLLKQTLESSQERGEELGPHEEELLKHYHDIMKNAHWRYDY